MKLGRYFVGLLSGLTFGMLFAPKQGKKLREELVKKGGESGHDAVAALYNAFKEAGTDAFGEMKKLSDNEQIQSALSMSKDKMREYLSQIEEGGYDLAAQAQEGLEEISNRATDAGKAFKKKVMRKKRAVKRAVKSTVKTAEKTVAKKVAKKVASKKSAPKKRAATKGKTVSKKK